MTRACPDACAAPAAASADAQQRDTASATHVPPKQIGTGLQRPMRNLHTCARSASDDIAENQHWLARRLVVGNRLNELDRQIKHANRQADPPPARRYALARSDDRYEPPRHESSTIVVLLRARSITGNWYASASERKGVVVISAVASPAGHSGERQTRGLLKQRRSGLRAETETASCDPAGAEMLTAE